MTRGFVLAKSRARGWFSNQAGFRLLDARHDDAFLVSYPRSGSTWLRTVLSNLLVPWGRANPDVFNALIPGVTLRGALRARALQSPRIISSHAPHQPGLPRAVYLVRDGRDALVSYHLDQKSRGGPGGTVPFATFLDEHLEGLHGPRWHAHVEGWLRAGRAELGDRLCVIRYEDLLTDPLRGMRSVVEFLGLSATDEGLAAAIEGASLETMRAVEARRLGGVVSGDRSFYRSGEALLGAGWFDDAMYDRFAEVGGVALSLCGYPLRPEHRP